MKFLLLPLLVLFTTFHLFAQESSEDQIYKNSLGMDVLPSFGFMFNGDVNYLEFGYVRSLKKLDLRAKINFDQNRGLNSIGLRRVEIQPADNLIFGSSYQLNHIVHLSLGVAKRFKKGVLNYYFGVDGDLGFKSGESNAVIFNEETSEVAELFETIKTTHHFVGLTPVFGAKIPLMPRVELAVELGVPLVYTFGEIDYLQENRDLATREISTKKVEFNRLLNDVRISFLF